MSPRVDDLVNAKYRVVRQLGEGGMGSVFEAVHERLGTRVALKFLHHELARRDEIMQRFVQEARLVASIKSPHVVQVNDVEQMADGTWFMVLEYLEGRTLQRVHHDMHKEGRRLTTGESLALALQILEGAAAAHAVGIVHRDLKPDNVMIVEGSHGEPFVKLLDFGIAKLRVAPRDSGAGMVTRPGIIMGTPEYMAPEQVFSADGVDARADVFAIGVMTFEMLAGCRPVAGDDPQILAAAHLAGDLPRLETLAPDLPAGLADVVHKGMAARAADRYASAAPFLAAIEPFVAAMFGPAPVMRAPENLVGQKTALLLDVPLPSAASSASPAARAPSAGAFETAPTPLSTPMSGGPSAPPQVPSAPGSRPADPNAKTSLLPQSGAPPSPPPFARTTDAAPTTRPAQNVVFDRASAPASAGPGAPPDAVAIATPSAAPLEPAAAAIIQQRPSRRGLWIVLGVVSVGVVAAVCIGLYIAKPSLGEDDPPHKRTHPSATVKKPPPKKR
jgi:serine/threonine-protein kinase